MKTLDETGLSENTIVIFVPDHGEYGGAHGGMLQKWHTAYQETVQVPVVVSLPSKYPVDNTDGPRQVSKLTSHIDLLPTLMGLAGIDEAERAKIARKLERRHNVMSLVGADLSGLILGTTDTITEPDESDRRGVLFATDDMITEYLEEDGDEKEDSEYFHDYKLYMKMVPFYREREEWSSETGSLVNGPVAQPCHVVAYREDMWKLVRYASHEGHNAAGDTFEWELYHLESDENEDHNLLVATSHTFAVNPAATLPNNMGEQELLDKANDLYVQMQDQITKKLVPVD